MTRKEAASKMKVLEQAVDRLREAISDADDLHDANIFLIAGAAHGAIEALIEGLMEKSPT